MASASAPAPTPALAKRWKVRETAITEAPAPAQPCDFQRAYRGTIGKTAVSYVLERSDKKPGELAGWVHYDREGPASPIRGRVAADGSFSFDEKPGGTLRGTCDKDGVLSGTFALGASQESFRLIPGAKGAPGHFEVARRMVSEPNHPACRGKTRPDRVVVVPGAEPPPDDPDRWVPSIYCVAPAMRKELALEGNDFRCLADDAGLRVFGLRDAALEKRVNRLLAGDDYERAVAGMRPCSGGVSFLSRTTLVSLTADTLVVSRSAGTFYNDATTARASEPGEPTIIDLATGRTSNLGDAVDLDKLAAVLANCLPIYDRAWHTDTDGSDPSFELPPREAIASCGDDDGFLWGCNGPLNGSKPAWDLVPEGLVISRGIIPSIAHGLEGAGPVLSWAVLAREGALTPRSPFAALSRGVPPAPPDALPCTSAVTFSRRLEWSPVIDERYSEGRLP